MIFSTNIMNSKHFITIYFKKCGMPWIHILACRWSKIRKESFNPNLNTGAEKRHLKNTALFISTNKVKELIR